MVFEDVTAGKRMEKDLHWELTIQNALTELYTPVISPDSTLYDISNVMLSRARLLTGSRVGFVSLIDPDTDESIIYAVHSGPDRSGTADPIDRDPSLMALRDSGLDHGEAFFANNGSTNPTLRDMPSGDMRLGRVLAAPIRLGDKTTGRIALADSDRNYTERDLSAIMRLAEFFALAVRNKQAEEKVKSSLREKVLMLKEIHHRIKNNLQVVMSLLNLQVHHLEDVQARHLFKENQYRIKSMALVHERLYQSTDLSHVDFKEYISKLAVDLFRAYRIDVETVKLTVQAENVTLGIDTSVPCGMIINELLLNSLKHAFPRDRKGCVSVSLVRTGADTLLLTVADDGVGLPEHFDLANMKSLGFNLVVALTEQLHGEIKIVRDNGTRIEIAFRARD
jgi:two-component sensor histidine kinase